MSWLTVRMVITAFGAIFAIYVAETTVGAINGALARASEQLTHMPGQ